jgi:hypothetical protein
MACHGWTDINHTICVYICCSMFLDAIILIQVVFFMIYNYFRYNIYPGCILSLFTMISDTNIFILVVFDSVDKHYR